MTDPRDEHEPYGFTESPVIAKMQAEIARLTAERDEARMQVCILGAVTTKLKQAPKTTLAEAMQIAEKFGWDCFSNEESGK